jgi:hypothetical protein
MVQLNVRSSIFREKRESNTGGQGTASVTKIISVGNTGIPKAEWTNLNIITSTFFAFTPPRKHFLVLTFI